MPRACRACRSFGSRLISIGQNQLQPRTVNGMMISLAFFNAVPRRDIVAAVKQLTQDYLRQSSCRVLSVDIASRTGHQGKPRGRNTSQFKRCWVEDIPLIVEVSFSTGVFTAAGSGWQTPSSKRRHLHRKSNFSCVVWPSCVDGRANVFEIITCCSHVINVVFAVC